MHAFARLCRILISLLASSFLLCSPVLAQSSPHDDWISSVVLPGSAVISDASKPTQIVLADGDAKVVQLAARDLATDLERVTGRHAHISSPSAIKSTSLILVGTLGKSPLLDQLVAAGKLDIGNLRGAWESFVVASVTAPMPGVDNAVVIVGSDARGTAFGIYELSQAIGVSPWHWWADVAPEKKAALYMAAGTRRFGPPSVRYRGIFINDEDWGLHVWAANNFEPEHKGIGPKTYAKVFELLLRLKANTLWPAMHAVSPPFNQLAANAALANDYGIVMGSSHAEPMLRNNVGEWKAAPESYNYVSNADGVRAYWEERLRSNGGYENIYTLGMRGIHDSKMQGPKTDIERRQVLETIFSDQRRLLNKYVNPDINQVPQVFCAYKEVLPLYRQGLQVPDDVTIIWPDDNFGYVRSFATAEERKRAGGFGVYYHLSYLGAPLSYLWLSTTPPALIWEEMSKSYDNGARNIWIANVGDLKPAEIGTEFFLQMAWDMQRWPLAQLSTYLRQWAGREFGATQATEIAAIMSEYYQLNYQRKPEHLQWWLPKESPRPSALSPDEITQRLAAFTQLQSRVGKVGKQLRADQQDAFFELVAYPVQASALANLRYFETERGNRAAAINADQQLQTINAHWNGPLAAGKWRGIMAAEPADDQWKSMRISKWQAPATDIVAAAPVAPVAPVAPPTASVVAMEAEQFQHQRANGSMRWELIPGLGRTGAGTMALFPTTAAAIPLAQAASTAPRLDYEFTLDGTDGAGNYQFSAYLIPTQPLSGTVLELAIAIDDGAPQLVQLDVKDGSAEWAQGVLNATRIASTPVGTLAAGKHQLHVYGIRPGIVVDKIVLHQGKLSSGYLGPVSASRN
ncbi:glycosyl hydrolase 115 family protein [Undibacterium sp. CY18W]|uniref:Glycosyl hydrolase 115 family protein n=1 Tax=Undibacterium hunanense TaxID=2762292 RepID=A0ABR6ZY82_9BURK|nr:glycosyl hydrolase 115 family protein [Undibacterium hunanense]MBC3920841.1 glycosyl hydrolase 115 family protein [Undibacterium hunanense]